MVKQFNYRQSRFERFAGIAPATLMNHSLRLPLALAGVAVLLPALTWAVEVQRLGRLDRELAVLQARVETARPAVERAKIVIAATVSARRLDERIRVARREAIASTNTIARLGNALPSRTWLTNIQTTTAGTWTIAGRSDRVAEIGTTLRAIQQFDPRATAQLVSISADGQTGSLLNFVIGWQQP